VRPEDSGNYTCEVHGRKSVILASVTHLVHVAGMFSETPALAQVHIVQHYEAYHNVTSQEMFTFR
jgi:hypothetical protein